MLPAIGSATKAKKKPALDVSDDDESGGSGEGGGEEGSDGEGSEAGGDVKPSQPAERVRSSGVRLINVQDGVESTEQHGGLDAGANGGRFLGDEDGEAGVEFRSLDDDIDAGERPRSRMAAWIPPAASCVPTFAKNEFRVGREKATWRTEIKMFTMKDVTYKQSFKFDGYVPSQRRVDTADPQAGYWRHKKLVTIPIKRLGSDPGNGAPKLSSGLPPHLRHWIHLRDGKERENLLSLYSDMYKSKKVIKWRMGDVFSFIADAYHDDQEVLATGEPAYPGMISEDMKTDARLDILVLRQVVKMQIDGRKFLFIPRKRLAQQLHLDPDVTSELRDAAKEYERVNLAVHEGMPLVTEDGAVEGMTGAETMEIASALHQEQVATEELMLAELRAKHQRLKVQDIKAVTIPLRARLEDGGADLYALQSHFSRTLSRATLTLTRSPTKGDGHASGSTGLSRSASSAAVARPMSSAGRPEPGLSKTELALVKSMDSLKVMKRGLSDDLLENIARYDTLHSEEIEQAALLREVEDEVAELRNKIPELANRRRDKSEALRALARRRVEAEEIKRQAAVAAADAKLTHAFEQFERLNRAEASQDHAARPQALHLAREALESAHRNLLQHGVLDQRKRRIEALGTSLEMREEKGAGAEPHMAVANDDIMAASGIDIEGNAFNENEPRVRSYLAHARTALEKARVSLNRTGAVIMFGTRLSDVEGQIAYIEGRLAEQAELQDKRVREGLRAAAAADLEAVSQEVLEDRGEIEELSSFERELRVLIRRKKGQALSTVSDSLCPMQAWLHEQHQKQRAAASNLPDPALKYMSPAKVGVSGHASQSSTRHPSPLRKSNVDAIPYSDPSPHEGAAWWSKERPLPGITPSRRALPEGSRASISGD